MRSKKPIVTYEFGTLYIEGQPHKEGDTPLGEVTFNNLWDFILSNKTGRDTDVVMSVHTRGGKRYIKTGRFVGTIQTRDSQVIEVLPKIYKASGQQEEDQKVCRQVFLNMLKHFTDARAKSFQNASLGTKKGFPILEVYISNYIDAVEQLVLGGLKKNYTLVAENQKFLKGKLDVAKQITKNVANKATFAIQYNKYIEDIPQNRIVVSTLKKLLDVSHSNTNKAHISALLTILADIPPSTNIEVDLRMAATNNRLFSSYDMLMKWSCQFLLNRGFTTFSGSCVNQSLLFQAERLFEDFIAYLFKKYAPNHNVDAQNTRYFLVDRHNGRQMFHLRPDILVESNPDAPMHDCIIIDTKWKALDSTRPDKNYLLDIKDIYQLYAYGQKYRFGESKERSMEVMPKLVLLYPYSEKFTKELPTFIYDDMEDGLGLKLTTIPFNLAEPNTYKTQIENIIRKVQGEKSVNYSDVREISTPVISMYTPIEKVSGLMMVAEDIFIYGSIPVDLPDTNRVDLIDEKLNLILMYAIGSGARQKTETAGKIALGVKESALKDEQMAAYKSLKYLMFHYWSNPKAYKLTSKPMFVDKDSVPADYLIRMEKDAVKFLLLEYNPLQSVTLGNINILKTQRRGEIRYLPFVTTLESIKDE